MGNQTSQWPGDRHAIIDAESAAAKGFIENDGFLCIRFFEYGKNWIFYTEYPPATDVAIVGRSSYAISQIRRSFEYAISTRAMNLGGWREGSSYSPRERWAYERLLRIEAALHHQEAIALERTADAYGQSVPLAIEKPVLPSPASKLASPQAAYRETPARDSASISITA